MRTASVLHIVDACGNASSRGSLELSEEWRRVYGLGPDFLFIGAAGHLERGIQNGERIIEEAATFTPAQAALLASRILPKRAAIIGMYNHSIWDDRYEMTLSAGDAETQFHWCLSYLAPSVEVKKLLPGETFLAM